MTAIEWDESILGRKALQKRSQEKVEKILEFSATAIERDGVYALNLNKVARDSGVNVATIYQFFPNKNAVIARLAVREFDENYDRVRAALDEVQNSADVKRICVESVFTYYQKSRDVRFMKELWAIIEADRNLSGLNRKDDERLARLIADVIVGFDPEVDRERVFRRILLGLGMIAAAIRHAMLCDETEGQAIMAEASDVFIEILM